MKLEETQDLSNFYGSNFNLISQQTHNNNKPFKSDIESIHKLEYKCHYICPKCHKFPFIEFYKDRKNIKFICSCINKKILIKDILDKTKNYITFENNNIQNDKINELLCIKHKNKFCSFCESCLLNECVDCQSICHYGNKITLNSSIKKVKRILKKINRNINLNGDIDINNSNNNEIISTTIEKIKIFNNICNLSIQSDGNIEQSNREINFNNKDLNISNDKTTLNKNEKIKIININNTLFELLSEEEENQFNKLINIIINDYINYPNYTHILKSNIKELSKWNINNVKNMSYMFSNCSSLKILPDISKWSTNNVTNMSNIFCKCLSLHSLPDISKWNTNNVKNMSNIFFNLFIIKIIT